VSQASRDELLTYLADLVENLERYAVSLQPPDDRDDIVLGQEPGRNLVVDLAGRLPSSRRSRNVDLDIFERWKPAGRDQWTLAEYRYELRNHEAGYRRALHRHDVDAFVLAFGVATHEHCEATMGVEACGHYFGEPVADAFDGFVRLYELWLTGQSPDCSVLTCLD
jgi:hypothetical protein